MPLIRLTQTPVDIYAQPGVNAGEIDVQNISDEICFIKAGATAETPIGEYNVITGINTGSGNDNWKVFDDSTLFAYAENIGVELVVNNR